MVNWTTILGRRTLKLSGLPNQVVAGYFRLLLPKIVYYILMAEKHLLGDDFSPLLTVSVYSNLLNDRSPSSSA